MESSLSIFIRDLLMFRDKRVVGRRLIQATWIGYLFFEVLGSANILIGLGGLRYSDLTSLSMLLVWFPSLAYTVVRLALVRIFLEMATVILISTTSNEEDKSGLPSSS